jgi:Photoprotection regulator fluorescence recovery protein
MARRGQTNTAREDQSTEDTPLTVEKPPMHNLTWSASEKKLARSVFDAAVAAELAELMAEFKAQAARVTEPHEMWAIGEDLWRKRRDFDAKYDFRYSQLLMVFGRLVREGRVQETQLSGLSEDKLAIIARIATL